MPRLFLPTWPKQPHTADHQPLHALLLAAAPPCLNMQAALDRLDGEADLYVKLMGPFLHESNHMMVGLKAPWPSCRWPMPTASPSASGHCRNMGASRWPSWRPSWPTRSALKRIAHGARPASWLPVEELEQALLAVHNACTGCVPPGNPSRWGGAVNAAELERARLRAELERFVAMLRNADPRPWAFTSTCVRTMPSRCNPCQRAGRLHQQAGLCPCRRSVRCLAGPVTRRPICPTMMSPNLASYSVAGSDAVAMLYRPPTPGCCWCMTRWPPSSRSTTRWAMTTSCSWPVAGEQVAAHVPATHPRSGVAESGLAG